MTIQLQRIEGTPMAQRLAIRSHEWVVDGTAAEGGDDTGPNPHDLYDAALGGCKALTLLWYAGARAGTCRTCAPWWSVMPRRSAAVPIAWPHGCKCRAT